MRYFINLVALVTYRLSQLAVLGTLAVVMGEVISRYVFNSPTQTSLEITEYLIVTMGFLPMAFIHQKGGHVSVELILHAYESGIASSSLMAFPMWIAYLPIPLGFFALGMQGLVILFPSLPDGKPN
jgi:TRAP-type C4-dicarboxylate transport system permease small subunit